jgi:hypothetical protein
VARAGRGVGAGCVTVGDDNAGAAQEQSPPSQQGMEPDAAGESSAIRSIWP